MLYGSVVEHVNMSMDEMQSILVRLIEDKQGEIFKGIRWGPVTAIARAPWLTRGADG